MNGRCDMRYGLLVFLLFATAVLSPSGNSEAEEITFYYEGEVFEVSGDLSLLGLAGVGPGTPFAGKYTFDSSVPNTSTIPQFEGIYLDTVLAYEVTVGEITLHIATDGVARISVVDDWPLNSFVDRYEVDVFAPDDGISGTLSLNSPQVIPCDPCPLSPLITSTALPVTPPDLDLAGTSLPYDRRQTVFLQDDAIVDGYLSELALLVSIEVQPRRKTNGPAKIRPFSNAQIAVAVLTTDHFYALSVDPESVNFGPSEAPASHGGHVQDVDKDGDMDLLFHFKTRATGITCTDSLAKLAGETFTGFAIVGLAVITTLGC
jgi:hypothetical protein